MFGTESTEHFQKKLLICFREPQYSGKVRAVVCVLGWKTTNIPSKIKFWFLFFFLVLCYLNRLLLGYMEDFLLLGRCVSLMAVGFDIAVFLIAGYIWTLNMADHSTHCMFFECIRKLNEAGTLCEICRTYINQQSIMTGFFFRSHYKGDSSKGSVTQRVGLLNHCYLALYSRYQTFKYST